VDAYSRGPLAYRYCYLYLLTCPSCKVSEPVEFSNCSSLTLFFLIDRSAGWSHIEYDIENRQVEVRPSALPALSQ
jgi:hypothetical protein